MLNYAGRLAIGKGAKMLTPTTFLLAVHAQTAFPLHNLPRGVLYYYKLFA